MSVLLLTRPVLVRLDGGAVASRAQSVCAAERTMGPTDSLVIFAGCRCYQKCGRVLAGFVKDGSDELTGKRRIQQSRHAMEEEHVSR